MRAQHKINWVVPLVIAITARRLWKSFFIDNNKSMDCYSSRKKWQPLKYQQRTSRRCLLLNKSYGTQHETNEEWNERTNKKLMFNDKNKSSNILVSGFLSSQRHLPVRRRTKAFASSFERVQLIFCSIKHQFQTIYDKII